MESYKIIITMLEKFEWNLILYNKYYLALFILICFGFISQFFILFFKTIARGIAYKTKTKIDDKVIEAIEWPFIYLILYFGIANSVQALQITPFILGFLIKLIFSIIVLFIVYAVFNLIKIFIEYLGNEYFILKNPKFEKEIVPFFTKIARIFSYIIIFLWISSLWGLNIIPYLASLGIIGFAVGLAIKDILANVIAGIVILADSNYNIDDQITYCLNKGKIIEIGLRATKLLTDDSELIIIPNSKFINEVIKKR